MNKIIKAALVFITMLVMTFTGVAAEEIIIDENYNSYSEGYVPQNITYQGDVVFTMLKYGTGKYSFYCNEEDGTKCLLSTVDVKSDKDSTCSYIFPSNRFISKFNDYFVMSLSFRLDKGNYVAVGYKSKSGLNGSIFIADNDTLKPVDGTTPSTDSNTWIDIDPDKFFDLKFIFNVTGGTYDFYCDGKLKGKSLKLRPNSQDGLFYFWIDHKLSNGEGQGHFYLDNIYVSSLKDGEMAISSKPDIYDANGYVGEFKSDMSEVKLVFDVINKTAGNVNAMLCTAGYDITSDGFSSLSGFKMGKEIFPTGCGRVEVTPVFVPQSENQKMKIFFWNGLPSANTLLNGLTFVNNGVTIEKGE